MSLFAASDKLKELQDRFDKESRAGGKIRELVKLGDAQFAAATELGKSGDFTEVGLLFEKYRDNVREALELLKKQEPDADKHPHNYRQLELEVRRGLREVEQTMLIAPDFARPPLGLVDKDLLELDDVLIKLLFPRHSTEAPKPAHAEEPKP